MQDCLEFKELWGSAKKLWSTFAESDPYTQKVRSFCEMKYCCVKRETKFSPQNRKGAQPSVC